MNQLLIIFFSFKETEATPINVLDKVMLMFQQKTQSFLWLFLLIHWHIEQLIATPSTQYKYIELAFIILYSPPFPCLLKVQPAF